jgi:hypothetical protein
MNLQRWLLPPLLLLAGCFPEERAWWSPQGDRALVRLADGLHLADADGQLGPVLVDTGEVQSVSWLPEGDGFVALRTRVVHRWEEARALLPATEVQAVEALLPLVLPLLETASRDARALDDLMNGLSELQGQRFAAALRLQHERTPAEIETRLQALPKGTELANALTRPEAGHTLQELLLMQLDKQGRVTETRPLVRRLLKPLHLPRVSPQLPLLAVLSLDDDGRSPVLEVLPLDGRPGHVVARQVSAAFDWTPDGRSLVFMAPLGGEGEKLVSLLRLEVVNPSGGLLRPRLEIGPDGQPVEQRGPDRLGNPVTLATALQFNRPLLQVLADGRVLFASLPVTLPAVTPDADLAPRLFLADGQTVTPVPTAPGDLPANLGWFTASPDGRRVAVVESETDAVAVVELATGATRILSPAHPGWQCRTLPAWKSATELTFAALHDGAPAWHLWQSEGDTRVLSGTWPAAALANWLEHKKAEAASPP